MHIRLPTEAANADSMQGDEAGDADAGNAAQPARANDSAAADDCRLATESSEAKPGEDINAPGFVRDKDSAKP